MLLKKTSTKQPTRGFTLIELLTVIAIIGILAAILIPVVGRVRESARAAKCGSNVRMLVQACHIFAEETGRFPPTEGHNPPGPPPGPQTNWILLLGQGGYTSKVVNLNNNGEEAIWFCPTAIGYRPGTNANSYGMNWQAGSWFTTVGNAGTPDRAMAATKTAMVMDGSWAGGTWRTFVGRSGAFPDFVHPPPGDPNDPSAAINVAFVDGHVERRRQNEVPTDLTDVFWSGLPSD